MHVGVPDCKTDNGENARMHETNISIYYTHETELYAESYDASKYATECKIIGTWRNSRRGKKSTLVFLNRDLARGSPELLLETEDGAAGARGRGGRWRRPETGETGPVAGDEAGGGAGTAGAGRGHGLRRSSPAVAGGGSFGAAAADGGRGGGGARAVEAGGGGSGRGGRLRASAGRGRRSVALPRGRLGEARRGGGCSVQRRWTRLVAAGRFDLGLGVVFARDFGGGRYFYR